MTDTRNLPERQAAWQRGRAALTGPEKIRMAEAVREWAAKFRRSGPPMTNRVSASRQPGSDKENAPQRQQDK